VAAGLVAFGIGGDGGGSIRIPAASCGLYGLKPTRGRVSYAPHAALWGALGEVGPLTRSVLDTAIVYDVIRGIEPGDRFRAPQPASSFTDAARLATADSQRKLRVGWSTRPAVKGWRPASEHVAAVEETAALLEGLGHQVVELDPRYPDATTAFVPQYVGGVRAEMDLLEQPEKVERRTKQLLALGRPMGPAVVARAERRGERIAALVDERVFARVDVLLTPVLAKRPPLIGRLEGAAVLTAAYRAQPSIAYTAFWNITGHPAASVPAGFAEDGLPLAVQLVGRHNDEPTLLALSAQLESVRPWADRTPPL
jgi:amidase